MVVLQLSLGMCCSIRWRGVLHEHNFVTVPRSFHETKAGEHQSGSSNIHFVNVSVQFQQKDEASLYYQVQQLQKPLLEPDFCSTSQNELQTNISFNPIILTVCDLVHYDFFSSTNMRTSSQQVRLQTIWKHAILFPLFKPGKLKTQGNSNRPISIQSSASKVLEKRIHQRIAPHLHLADTQQGFRTCRSTTTALLPLVQHAAVCFKQRCSQDELW